MTTALLSPGTSNPKPRNIMLSLTTRFRAMRATPRRAALILALSILCPAALTAQYGGNGNGNGKHEDPGIVTFSGPFPAAPTEPAFTIRADEESGRRFDINAVVVTGDRIPVYSLDNWDDYENNALYEPMSEADIESFRQRLLKELQDNGYLFATVSVYRPSLKLGFLKLRVHVGEKGEVTVRGNRWYSAEQVLEDIEWETGGDFNYSSLYEDLFTLNLRPRMKVETELKPRVDADGKRVVDVEFDVKDRFPLHLAWNISNSGTEETGKYRSRVTAQFNNLFKRDELFTLEWLTDPAAISDVFAFSGSYYMPITKKWGFTFYAGFSESNLDNVIPALDIIGKGHYFGGQFSRKIRDTEGYSVDLSLGWLFQETRNTNILEGGVVDASRAITLSTPRVTIGYAAKQFDNMGGRNFVQNTVIANFGGLLGSSDYDPNTEQSPGAEPDFFVDRLSVARYQKLFGSESKLGQWSLFARFEGQWANAKVPSAMQFGAGGQDSVRGYRERQFVGDYGFNATLELRTPLFENFIPNLKRDEEFIRDNPTDWAMHRAQFVFFYDHGWVAFRDPLPGQGDDTTLNSIGAGVRFDFTKYSQIRFDYGFQLQDLADDDAGRAHFSVQLQY